MAHLFVDVGSSNVNIFPIRSTFIFKYGITTAVINCQRKVHDLGLAACFSKSAPHECSFNLIFETRILPFHTLPLMKTYQFTKTELTLEQTIRPTELLNIIP